jgi:molybdate transport system substrate-binding protein
MPAPKSRLSSRSRRWLASVVLALPAVAHADQVQVAVASNFRAPMERVAELFKRQTGHEVVAAYGATGTLYAQIRNGAPFAVLLAADNVVPLRLENEGAAMSGSRFTYAVGALALWSPRADYVDARGQVLREAHFEHLAVADPKLAPYGAAAQAVMQALGVDGKLAPKLVQGQNIGQTLQFVSTGNAELGFVSLSQVWSEGKLSSGSAWIVPRELYPPIRQDAVLLNAGRDQPAARALLDFLRTPACRELIASFGYQP